MADEALEAFFGALGPRIGTPDLDDEETREVLDLARVVAHRVERRYAPLTAYVAGLALGADGADHPERLARLRELITAVERLAD